MFYDHFMKENVKGYYYYYYYMYMLNRIVDKKVHFTLLSRYRRRRSRRLGRKFFPSAVTDLILYVFFSVTKTEFK